MGWDNTTELTAGVIDAVNVLTRVLINVNTENPDRTPVERVPRPYEVKAPAETITLTEFGDWLKED